MQEPFFIKKIAVLGAGVMGAQIAAHCVNAGFNTLLFDLPSKEGDADGIVNKSIANLAKLKPSPLGTPQTATLLHPRNYEEDVVELKGCDLIVEVIAERLDLKQSLYERIAPYLSKHAILVSNTSGLSINTLTHSLPETLRSRFCGVHFFNPPRYMHLVELIPAKTTSPDLLEDLETWITRYLGKGVVRAHDTPNFIANRVGVFSMLVAMHHAQAMGLGFDEVDALTGSLLGRPKSATFRTMDVVGLDTMAHVVDTMQQQLSNDPWSTLFSLPEWLTTFIKNGNLGQKTGQGIYRKNGKIIEVYDVSKGEYRLAGGEIHDEVKAIMRLPSAEERMQKLWASKDSQARFLAACFRDLFHYSAFHLQEIASTVRDVDLAIRWGFGWQQGPFETWQASGVKSVRHLLEHAIEKQETLSSVALPTWADKVDSFYSTEGAFSPSTVTYKGRSTLPVYERQFFPDAVLNETRYKVDTVFENEGIHLWHLKDDVMVVNFKSKANSIGQSVLDGINQALNIAQGQAQGLIIYQNDASNFSSGANLKEVSTLIKGKQFKALDKMIEGFQQLVLRLKYSSIPTVAALRGRALGGGCELMMHCDEVAAAFESYPGLVEVGVGLIPAGGGCKEMARRAALKAGNADLMTFVQPYFEQIATAFVAGSAPEAQEKGYLTAKDSWVMHNNEVLYSALAKIKYMQAANYLPPVPQTFKVAGREGHARLQVGLVNWLEGGFISQHDYFLANHLASVLCGGAVNAGESVDDAWMLKIEREAFIVLAESELTQARISHLLETGKPLRN